MGRIVPTVLVMLTLGCSAKGGRASVLQHHNDLARDGLYLDPALTRAAVIGAADGGVGGLRLEPSFAQANVVGQVYAQPLYLAGSGSTPDLVIVATEMNNVYAFDAATGTQVWTKSTETLGMPATTAGDLPCGNITPNVGVTGTPVIDGATRTLYLDAMSIDTATGARVVEHKVHALDAATGNERSGWPVDLNSTATSGETTFDSELQNQRGALTLVGGKVLVPFSGHVGDCAGYHGWVVGVSTSGTPTVTAWATRAIAGGIWGASGIASDGTSIYFATGNSKSSADAPGVTSSGDNGGSWGDSETVYKFPLSLTPPQMTATTEYFVPGDWIALDDADADMGGTSPILVNVPGANPSNLVVALGKNNYAYLLDRANLGGMDATPIATVRASVAAIINAAVAYTTRGGTYVVLSGRGYTCPTGQSGGLTALKISATTPPTLSTAWCGAPMGSSSPTVSQSESGGSDTIVWVVGSDNYLHGLDGDTGASVFAGGPTALAPVQTIQVPIVANGRIFVASNSQIYAFTVGSN
ncbi:MAG TPA: PQQ-binding-like beta-propeller repeat protein [Polyangia bacterium]|nr:PQQ-binding-like beta-propeller repeat protein [Polyangia bacterium]